MTASRTCSEVEPLAEGHHQRQFLAAMRRLAAGVCIVTTKVGGRAWAVTVSSSCSVSLEPDPAVLICLRRKSAARDGIVEQGSFGLSILDERQCPLARMAAAPDRPKFIDDADDLDAVEGSLNGIPIVQGALASLACEVESIIDAGDHTIFLGVVRDVAIGEAEGRPLLYYAQEYRHLGRAISKRREIIPT